MQPSRYRRAGPAFDRDKLISLVRMAVSRVSPFRTNRPLLGLRTRMTGRRVGSNLSEASLGRSHVIVTSHGMVQHGLETVSLFRAHPPWLLSSGWRYQSPCCCLLNSHSKTETDDNKCLGENVFSSVSKAHGYMGIPCSTLIESQLLDKVSYSKLRQIGEFGDLLTHSSRLPLVLFSRDMLNG